MHSPRPPRLPGIGVWKLRSPRCWRWSWAFLQPNAHGQFKQQIDRGYQLGALCALGGFNLESDEVLKYLVANRGRLMRLPLSGGPLQTLFNVSPPTNPDFRCPTRSAVHCVLTETDAEKKQIVFSRFDPANGQKVELTRLSSEPGGMLSWDLSPDGSNIACCRLENDSFKINVLRLADGREREIPVEGWVNYGNLAWSADGTSWFAQSRSPQGGSLLHIAADGQARFLKKSSVRYVRPLPSPEGLYLAYSEETTDSNAWMIDNLP